MAAVEDILNISELGPSRMRAVTLDMSEVVVADVGGRYCAFGVVCPHGEGVQVVVLQE